MNSSTALPYVFVGDEAFPLRPDFLKPFGRHALTQERKIYNYRLSRARRVIENVFGIMSNRFKMFSTPINLSIDRIDLVVLTCCILHNFLRRLVPHYSQIDQFDIDDDAVDETVPVINLESLDITTYWKLQ